MPEQVNRTDPEIDWPEGYPRTPQEDREPYPGDLSPTRKESFQSVVDELERWGATDVRISTASQHYVDRPNIPHQHDKPDDVGVVARFRRLEGDASEGYAIACDRWASQRENARAIALYARRKRLAEKCGVTTANSEFATARLPPGENETSAAASYPVVSGGESTPHEVLGVAPDAPDDVVSAVARRLMAKHHADGDEPDSTEFDRVRKARDAILEGENDV